MHKEAQKPLPLLNFQWPSMGGYGYLFILHSPYTTKIVAVQLLASRCFLFQAAYSALLTENS